MNKLILSALTIGILTGCGGGGGGDSSPADNSATESPTVYKQDGLYLNDSDLTLMVVDSDESQHGVIVGDYDGVNSSIYIVDSITSSENTIKTTGLTYVKNGYAAYDPSIETTVNFSETGADVSGTINGSTLLYSFDRTADSETLDNITGTHTNPEDGQEWNINADGSFTIYSSAAIGCTVTGNMEMVKGYYYRADNVTLSGCTDPQLNNNNYTGVITTVNQNGTTYLLGVLSNGIAVIWGSTPK